MQKFLFAPIFFLSAFQKYAKLITAYTITISKICVSFFNTFCNLSQAKIPLHMTIAVIDLFEIIHIKNYEHASFTSHLTRLPKIAVLVQ